jgi:hypothetical protein
MIPEGFARRALGIGLGAALCGCGLLLGVLQVDLTLPDAVPDAALEAAGDGGGCDALACSGCCSAGACVPGDTIAACGRAGAVCAVCTASGGGVASCEAGTCAVGCDATHIACDGACCAAYGNVTKLSSSGNYSANALCTRPLTIAFAGTLASLGVISVSSGTQIALGLYTDDAGTPGTLVAQTSAGTLNGGTLVLPAPNTPLAAGKYWFAASFSASTSVVEDPTTVTAYCTTSTFGGAFPSPYPSVTSYSGRIANFFVLVK